MVSAAQGSPRKVKDMVTYFEKQQDHTVERAPRRKRISMAAMMSLTRRPWEHFPRRKSSASTDRRRRSSTSTRSNSTTYDPAEEYMSESGYAASERSATSTVVSESRRRSENPDYDWEHDSIADLKASLTKLDLSSMSKGSPRKGSETTHELHVVDPSGLEEGKRFPNGTPGVHEIDFVDPSAPRTAEIESSSEQTKEKNIPTFSEPADHAEASNSDISRTGIDEDELATKSAAVESKAAENADSSQQFAEAKIPPRMSSAAAVAKAKQLRVKTAHPDKDRKSTDATTSPSSPGTPSPSPKSKARPKLALDLPGIPESEAETLVRNRRPSMSMIQRLPSSSQGQRQQAQVHVNKSSRPPVSMSRYPVRSISAPLPGQQEQAAFGPPREMMQLVSQRQVKFTNIREEKMRRLSGNGAAAAGTSRPGSLMGRRHASAPVSEAAHSKRLQQRRRSGPVRPSLVQRLSLSHRFSVGNRRQSFSQAIKGYIRSPRRPSWLMVRTRSKTR